MKIARKLRDDLLTRYTEMRRKPNVIKAFQTMLVTETGVFQDRLVMTVSISLRILFCRAAYFAQSASESGGAVCPIRHFRNSKYITDSVRCQGFFARPRAAGVAAVFASRMRGWEIFVKCARGREVGFFVPSHALAVPPREKSPLLRSRGIPDKLFLSFHCLPDRGHITP